MHKASLGFVLLAASLATAGPAENKTEDEGQDIKAVSANLQHMDQMGACLKALTEPYISRPSALPLNSSLKRTGISLGISGRMLRFWAEGEIWVYEIPNDFNNRVIQLSTSARGKGSDQGDFLAVVENYGTKADDLHGYKGLTLIPANSQDQKNLAPLKPRGSFYKQGRDAETTLEQALLERIKTVKKTQEALETKTVSGKPEEDAYQEALKPCLEVKGGKSRVAEAARTELAKFTGKKAPSPAEEKELVDANEAKETRQAIKGIDEEDLKKVRQANIDFCKEYPNGPHCPPQSSDRKDNGKAPAPVKEAGGEKADKSDGNKPSGKADKVEPAPAPKK